MDKSKLGKQSRRKGKRFENEVQAALEKEDWIVARWSKKIEEGVLINCRPKWAGGRLLTMQSGFPDFIILRMGIYKWWVRLIECKLNGYLTPDEREQVKFLKKLGFIIQTAYKKDGKIQFRLE